MSKKNRTNDRAARAAAAMLEQQRQERRRRNRMVAGVVVALVLVVLVGFLLSRALDTTSDVDAPAAGSEHGLTVGSADAPHTVIIYEDFLCPFCGELEKRARDDLAQLAADGKVRVEYRPFNLLGGDDEKSYSVRSAGAWSIVQEKSGAEVAKKFHDLLFEHQPSESGPFPKDDELVDLAVEAGATKSDVASAIEQESGRTWVDAATAAADSAGVSSTPTILLDGKVFQDGRTIDQLADNLLKQLK